MRTLQLLFGAAYYDEYMPYDRLDQDMKLMKKAGMNTIRIAESTWSTLEPREGIYDFTHLDRMLDAAVRYEMDVIIGTPTYAIPVWLAKKSPDILALTHQGQELYGRRQNMDIINPIYLQYAERIIRVLLEHVWHHPRVIGFQIDNETKHYGTTGTGVQKKFVSYLQEQFPDIREFNREFGLDYWSNRIDDWCNFPDIRGTINNSLHAEFEIFRRRLVTDFFHWQAGIINEYKTPTQFITQNFDFEWIGHSYGLQPDVNQFEAAASMTIAGADIYHPSQDDLTGAEITLCGNIARGLKKNNYLVLETQAQGNLSWLPYPGQLRLCAYSHIANGANSVLYWNWHSIHNAIESYWKGVLSHDFSENETYREACLLGAEFKRIGDRLKNLRKTNQIAVIADNESLTGLREFPIPGHEATGYNDVLRWICDGLHRASMEYDILPADTGNFDCYRMVIAPALYSAGEKTLRRLDNYVKKGGILIATFKTGFCDKHLKIYHDSQPHLLTDCLGITYRQFTQPKEVSLNAPLLHMQNTKVDGWMELICPDSAETLAFYSHPVWSRYAAITKNSYGNGRAFYLGCLFDAAGMDGFLSYIRQEFFPELPEISFPLVRKIGTNEAGNRLTYYFNYSGCSCSFSYPGGKGMELLGKEEVRTGDMLLLEPWDVKIIEADQTR